MFKKPWPESIELEDPVSPVKLNKNYKLELLKLDVVEEFDDILNDNIFMGIKTPIHLETTTNRITAKEIIR